MNLFQRPDKVQGPLYVVTTVFNPERYRTRWKLFQDFEKMVKNAGAAELYVVEVQFGDREFVVTDANNPRHLQLHTESEIWLKESSLNCIIRRLPLDWEYVAWVDADILFARSDWADETLHALQHYDLVQMWSEAQDLDPSHQVLQCHQSFMSSWVHNNNQAPDWEEVHNYYGGSKKTKGYWHPGFAWAARRSAIDQLGGLLDFAILGSADYHMAYALIGSVKSTFLGLPRYNELLQIWEDRAEKYIKRNVGYVPGLILHSWHGAKVSRRYKDRWKILVGNQFNPDLDLKPDWQGLHQLTDRSPGLRDELRAYLKQRDEDNTYTDPRWKNVV